MEKASASTMEMGNLIFGNSRGEYAIDRSTYQDMFHEFLEACGFDIYGFSERNGRETGPDGSFTDGTVTIRPYYWGDDEAIAALPNFEYKTPDGTTIAISWYKYAMRDAYCSHDLSPEQFRSMLDACSAHLNAA